jgi:hypothetical protein
MRFDVRQNISSTMLSALNRQRIRRILIAVFAVYSISYLILSLQGRYEPQAIGLNGVKWYGWAPRGFVTDFRWNSSIGAFYLPLYSLDTSLWHTSDRAYSDRYPVNKVSASEIGRVYHAWSPNGRRP